MVDVLFLNPNISQEIYVFSDWMADKHHTLLLTLGYGACITKLTTLKASSGISGPAMAIQAQGLLISGFL